MSSSIIASFKSLNVASAQDYSDHEAIFQASYQYLAKVKEFKDIKAVHNVIVSLINTDRYYKALEFFKQVPEEILQEFPLEKAYIYYKTGHIKSVEEIYATSVGSDDLSNILKTALKHVMAQCYYQNGKVAEALRLYHELLTHSSGDNELDIACNERAVISQLPVDSSIIKSSVTVSEDDKTYDFLFNEALVELRSNNIEASLSLLKKASLVCTEQNIDSNPADLASELAPIELALAYVYHVSGHHSQAVSTLKSLDMEGVTDLLTKNIVKGNLISLSETCENVNYVSRELNYKDVLHVNRNKMTRSQYRSLVKNHLLLSYQSGTLSKSSKYLQNAFLADFSQEFGGDATPALIKLLLRLKISVQDLNTESNWTTLSKKIYKFALEEVANENVSDNAVAASMLLLSVNSKSRRFDQSIDILEKITQKELISVSSRLHAALFSALIHLYEITKSHKKLTGLYTTLVKAFGKLSAEELQNNSLYAFVRDIVFKLISVDSSFEVVPILKTLMAAKPEDETVLMILTGDTSAEYIDELVASEDVMTLLDVNIDQLINLPPSRPLSGKGKRSTYKVTKKARKAKFSKAKVVKSEKEFNAEKDLDQERWLPMKLRSYYKPSKKDLKKKSGGHQGAVELSPAPSTPTPSASKSKQKQKKKKGKK